MAPKTQLLSEGAGCVDEVTATVFIDAAEAHRMTNVGRTEVLAARPWATRLRTAPVLGGSQERHGRHGLTKPTTDMRAFTRRSQTKPRDRLDWGAPWQRRPKWSSPVKKRRGPGCEAPNRPTKQPPKNWSANLDSSWKIHTAIFLPWSLEENCAGEEPTPSPKRWRKLKNHQEEARPEMAVGTQAGPAR